MKAMSIPPDRTDNIWLKMDNGHYKVAETAAMREGLKIYMPGDGETYDWSQVQSEFNFIGWDYLDLEPVVVEWERSKDGNSWVFRIGNHFRIVCELENTFTHHPYLWTICWSDTVLRYARTDSLESAQAAAIEWLNSNLANIRKARMK